ncbi:MAG: tRNA lysidine(34) synthetase TilS [Lachnospiraceae bacterium]|nr:tRNA lysidine(34) synthetase TilS [Lachnospiraceae bacterium]MEE3461774.1 tRNA lysidine(34) synthetase TilS [Lachnospiraceae bacterium]
MNLIDKIAAFSEEHKLLERGDTVVAGISGGSDSVFLLHFLNEVKEKYHLKIIAVHVNHMLRGADADRDMEFTRKLTLEYGLIFEPFKADIGKMAAEDKLTEEEAGRIYRYSCFDQVMRKYNGTKTAVAHHMDDQAETVLFQLLRGSALKGLCGMQPRKGVIIRPLLCTSKDEIRDYLKSQHMTWCEDSTNDENDHSRNRIRNELLPYIEENLMPRAREHISETAFRLQKVYEYIDAEADQAFEKCVSIEKDHEYLSVDTDIFNSLPQAVRDEVIIKCLERVCGRRKDITGRHIEAAVDLALGRAGRSLFLPYGMHAVKFYDSVRIYPTQADSIDDSPLYLNGRKCLDLTAYDGRHMTLKFSIIEKGSPEYDSILRIVKERAKGAGKKKQACDAVGTGKKKQACDAVGTGSKKQTCDADGSFTEYFDCDNIGNHLCMRHSFPEDTIMSGKVRKKLSRLFIDCKVPEMLRSHVWMLADDNGVICIPELKKTGSSYYIGPQTVRILKFSAAFE